MQSWAPKKYMPVSPQRPHLEGQPLRKWHAMAGSFEVRAPRQFSTDISGQIHSNVYLSGNIRYRSASSPQALFYSCELRQVFTDARLGLGNYIATNTDRWISTACYRSYEYAAWQHCVCFTLILCQIIQPLSDTCINDTPLNITLWKGRVLERQLHLWDIKLDEITVHTKWCCCYLEVRYDHLSAKVGIQHVPFLSIAAIFCTYSYLHTS